MQIGVITVDGFQIGTVDMASGDDVDDVTPDLGGVPEHAGGGSYHPAGSRASDGHASHGNAAHTSDRGHHHTGQAAVEGDPTLAGSAYLKSQRSRAAEELKDPNTRREVAGMLATEGERDPVPVAESLFNRQAYTGKTLHELLHSGFYGPIGRGELPGAMSQIDRDHERSARLNKAIDTALAGSNTIRGATDQGLPTDPNGRWMGGRVERGGNIFNDWGGGPGGHEGARRFREKQQYFVNAAEIAAAKPFDPDTMAP